MTVMTKPEDAHDGAAAPAVSVLFVDDEINILSALRRLFRDEEFTVLTASSGPEGLDILKRNDTVALIISDQRMPDMTGAVFLQEARELFPDIPRMILTGYADVAAAMDAINKGGAYRFLTKPWNDQELRLAVRDGLHRYQLVRENQRLTELVRQQNAELTEWNTSLKSRVLQQTSQLRQKIATARTQDSRDTVTIQNIVAAYADLLALRVPRFARHFRSVAELAEAIAEHLGLEPSRREEIRMAALLHDVGWIGAPDRLLSRNRQMSPEEMAEFKLHPERGQAALARFAELREVGILICHHHENFDGSGFPAGLAGDRIPLGARIINLANWMDNAFSRDERPDARYQLTKQMAREMGRRFDPALAAAASSAVMKVLRDPPVLKDLSEEKLPVSALRPGMILTRDVFSSTGIQLIERRSRLDEGDIEMLRRYLGSDRSVHVLKTSMG